MSFLLDVNVLIAMHDANHVHHDLAHLWFRAKRAEGWASCPLTVNGFARIMSNPAYVAVDATAEEVLRRLRALCAAPDHTFWPADVSLMDETRFQPSLIAGSNQIADVYLLGLAVHHGGRLATFDRTIPWKAVMGATAHHVEVIGG
jgi:hypothetical protein